MPWQRGVASDRESLGEATVSSKEMVSCNWWYLPCLNLWFPFSPIQKTKCSKQPSNHLLFLILCAWLQACNILCLKCCPLSVILCALSRCHRGARWGFLCWQCYVSLLRELVSVIPSFCSLVELRTSVPCQYDWWGRVCSFQNINSDFPEGLILFEVPGMLPPSLALQCFIH